MKQPVHLLPALDSLTIEPHGDALPELVSGAGERFERRRVTEQRGRLGTCAEYVPFADFVARFTVYPVSDRRAHVVVAFFRASWCESDVPEGEYRLEGEHAITLTYAAGYSRLAQD